MAHLVGQNAAFVLLCKIETTYRNHWFLKAPKLIDTETGMREAFIY